ncbi:hypothetical protein FRC20_002954 [Serendipita sp. 405]|nr:hypothetical protein FRC20_002954 [Serendipita sp. 405]
MPCPSSAAHDVPCVLDIWSIFSDKLVKTFGLPDTSEYAEAHLLSLAMLDSHHVYQYAIKFSVLAVQTSWSDSAKCAAFRNGLPLHIKDLVPLNNLTFDLFDDLQSYALSADQCY